MQVVDNPAQSRFEMVLEDGSIAFCDYRERDGALWLTHAEVPRQHEGKGIGARLAKGLFEVIRETGRKAVPRCAFIVAYVRRHPEVSDLLAA